MAKAEWGIKRICPSCSARYYDMRKDPPVCPNCNTQFDPEALLRSRRARPAPVEEVAPRAKVVDAEDEEVLEREETETEDVEAEADIDAEEETEEAAQEDDVLLEDASELGEEEDIVDVDVEGEEEEDR